MTVPPLRIVLDTNVYISAALRGHLSETILELAATEKIFLIASEVILTEIEEKLRGKLEWSLNQTDLFLQIVRDLAVIVEPTLILQVVPDDEDDNRILECALAGNADLIVTFDNDLLRLKSYEMIGIITPRQLFYYGIDVDQA